MPGQPLDDLRTVARLACDDTAIGEDTTASGTVLVVRWQRRSDHGPATTEWDVVDGSGVSSIMEQGPQPQPPPVGYRNPAWLRIGCVVYIVTVQSYRIRGVIHRIDGSVPGVRYWL